MTLAAGPGSGSGSGSLVADGLVAGLEAEALATEFGTPLFVYDLDLVTARAAGLRSSLPPSLELAFAVKSNPLLAMLEHVGSLGLGADVASAGELRHVLRAGFDPSRIVVTGPGKDDALLAAAIDAGVRAITAESRRELGRLATIAEAAGRVQPVLLRLSVDDGSAERRRIIGDGGAGKFGMDERDLRAAATEAAASPWLDPLGIHAFGASNVLDADRLVDHVSATVAFAASVAAEAGFALRLVDAGGGLGIPYRDDEVPLDLPALGAGLAHRVGRLAEDPATATTTLLLEPGRYVVGPAGAYLTRVIDRKRVRGTHVAILDGGIHHLLRPALVGQEHRVVALTGLAAGAATAADPEAITLAGPLCTGLDILAGDAPLAGVEPGDFVAILDAGAYGATESMPLFLSHRMPAEVVVRAGIAHLGRPPLEPETWLDHHRPLPRDR
jgi:diaminopimelate decarboxylase